MLQAQIFSKSSFSDLIIIIKWLPDIRIIILVTIKKMIKK